MFLELSDELTKRHVEHTVVLHTRTRSAMAEARAVGVTADEVAKTVVALTDDGYVRAVVAASERLDLAEAVPRDRLADEAAARD